MIEEQLLNETNKILNNQEEQYKDDELALQKLKYVREKTANFARELNNTFVAKQKEYSYKFGKAVSYSTEEILRMLDNPSANSGKLIEVSEYLYDVSGIYKRLIQQMSTMHSLEYTVYPMTALRESSEVEKQRMKDSFVKTLTMLDGMELKDEIPRNLKIAWKRGVVYLFENEEKDSYYLQSLPHKYCKIVSIHDGVYNIAFDFSYFSQSEELLSQFSPYFEQLYSEFKHKKGSYNGNWVTLDPNKAFAIKIDNEDTENIIPPFASLFPDIKDLEQAKQRKKMQEQIDNYLLLVQHIPVNDKTQTIDSFKVSFDLSQFYHNQALATLPEEIGILTTPMEITSIKTQKPHNSEDTLATKTKAIYDSASISQFLFNSDKATGSGVSNSIKSLEQIVLYVGKQFERAFNRKLKSKRWSYRFKMRFLDITSYNREDALKRYLDGGNSGFPTTLSYSSALGMSPLEFVNTLQMENDVLGFRESMIPWLNAHTMNSNQMQNERGREKKSVDKISDSTDTWRESDSAN